MPEQETKIADLQVHIDSFSLELNLLHGERNYLNQKIEAIEKRLASLRKELVAIKEKSGVAKIISFQRFHVSRGEREDGAYFNVLFMHTKEIDKIMLFDGGITKDGDSSSHLRIINVEVAVPEDFEKAFRAYAEIIQHQESNQITLEDVVNLFYRGNLLEVREKGVIFCSQPGEDIYYSPEELKSVWEKINK